MDDWDDYSVDIRGRGGRHAAVIRLADGTERHLERVDIDTLLEDVRGYLKDGKESDDG